MGLDICVEESSIPAILAATVLVAGMFAFMPIDKASSVHTTIAANINSGNRAMSWAFEDAAGTNIIIPAKANLDIAGTVGYLL